MTGALQWFRATATAPDGARARLARPVRFGCVGGIATVAQYLVLVALVRGAAMAPVPASAFGFCLSAVLNYRLNYHFTFRSDKRHRDAALRFAALAGAGLALNSAGMALGVRGLGMNYLMAQLVTTILVVLWNFLGNEFWTFRQVPASDGWRFRSFTRR